MDSHGRQLNFSKKNPWHQSCNFIYNIIIVILIIFVKGLLSFNDWNVKYICFIQDVKTMMSFLS